MPDKHIPLTAILESLKLSFIEGSLEDIEAVNNASYGYKVALKANPTRNALETHTN